MTSKRSAMSEISKYVALVNHYINENYRGSETNTVVKFAVPLFRLLGWDERSEDVEFEHKLKGGSADIALKLRGRPKILVEVKCIQDDLSNRTAEQATKYLHTSGVRWGVICNGREIRLYDMRYIPKKSKRGREIFRMSYEYYEKYFDILRLLSRGKVMEGLLDAVGDHYLKIFRETEHELAPVIKRILKTEEARLVLMSATIKKVQDQKLHTISSSTGRGHWSRLEFESYMDHLMKHVKKSYAYFDILTVQKRPITKEDMTRRIARRIGLEKLSPIAIAGIRAGIDKHTRRSGKEELELETPDHRIYINPKYHNYFSEHFSRC